MKTKMKATAREHIQKRRLSEAIDAANLAVERLGQIGLEVTARQHVVIQGAFLQVSVDAAIARIASFCQTVQKEAQRLSDLEELSNEELADLLMDRVWSMMEESEESTIIEAAIERLKLLGG